jgi:DNA-binding NtrC family response regulator
MMKPLLEEPASMTFAILPGQAAELVAVIDDDEDHRSSLRASLERAGYRVVEHPDADDASEWRGEPPVAVFACITNTASFGALRALCAQRNDACLIVVTSPGETEWAVAAVRAGAYDVLSKPVGPQDLALAMARAAERRTLLSSVRRLEEGIRDRQPTGDDETLVPLRELERRAIARALRHTEGNVGRAAKLLGIGRATLYRRLATLDALDSPAK